MRVHVNHGLGWEGSRNMGKWMGQLFPIFIAILPVSEGKGETEMRHAAPPIPSSPMTP